MMRTGDVVSLLILVVLLCAALILVPIVQRQDGFSSVAPGSAAWAPKDYWPEL